MEIGLYEWQLAYGDIYIGVRGWIRKGSPRIAKNGYISVVTEIEKPSGNMGQGTNPCSAESDKTTKIT